MSKQLHLLHITPHLGGGVGSVVLGWVKKDTCGNLHTIISLDRNNNNDWIEVNQNYAHITIYDDCYKQQNFETTLKKHIEKSDVVIMHWWNHPLLYDVMINYKLPPCRLLLWAHANCLFPPYSIPPKLFTFVDKLIFTTPVSYECNEVKDLSVEKKKLDVILSTTDITNFATVKKNQHKTFNIGYVGTADFGKLNRNFVKLCLQVDIPNVKFIVVCGDSQQHLIDEAVSLGCMEKFKFMRNVPHSKISEVFSDIDVFGYPLNSKHFGSCEQVLGEAMITGCVPVVLANPVERHIVNHMETGIVASTLEEYPRAIEYLYKNPQLLKKLAENAQTFAKKQYDINATIEKWNDLFEAAMTVSKREHVWDLTRLQTLSPAELYAQSLDEYGIALVQYIHAEYVDEKLVYVTEIKQLFDTNPMFYSKSKGSVLQYLQFFPDDKILQEWKKIIVK